MAINIKNKLIVIGNRVLVPGHEPLTENTTNSLSIAMQGVSTFLDVNKALELIPGSRLIVSNLDSGSFGHNLLFELPSGPPPDSICPRNCFPDWYAILRDAARLECERKGSLLNDCDAYSIDNCEYTDFYNDLDPAKR